MREALDLALEALKIARDQIVDPEYAPIGWSVSRLDEVLSIGRQARSAPVQEPWKYRRWNDEAEKWELTDDCGWPSEPLYTTPPAQPATVQEPVAVIGSGFQLLYCREDWAKGLKIGDTLCLCTPPAAQRQCEDDK